MSEEDRQSGGESVATEPNGDDVERLVRDVMAVERLFGHAARNVQSERKDKIREAIERIAGRNA